MGGVIARRVDLAFPKGIAIGYRLGIRRALEVLDDMTDGGARQLPEKYKLRVSRAVLAYDELKGHAGLQNNRHYDGQCT